MKRCGWAKNDRAVEYHDREWGVPVRDERLLFEFLILEGAQAGLSWDTILKKRERYREVFDGFDAEKVSRYGARKIAALMDDPGIVRNRLKIEGAVKNARAALRVREEWAGRGGLPEYLWTFVGGRPKVNRRRELSEIPASSAESDAMSKDLKRRGFTFVGTTICYAFMQATGMVNDHLVSCYRHREISGE